MDTMARGRLRRLLLLSLAMVMVMDMDMDITATMARGLLMLSPDMDTMVIMDMAVATMDKFLVISFQSSVQREFGPFGTSLELQ